MQYRKTIKRTFVHDIFEKYISLVSEEDAAHFFKELAPFSKFMCCSRSGSYLVMKTIQTCDKSDQKKIVGSLEEELPSLCSDSNAYLVICAIISTVELEGLLRNKIGKLMNENIEYFFEDKFAKRILMYLISSSEFKDFPSDMQKRLSYIDHTIKNPAQLSLFKSCQKKIVTFVLNKVDQILDDIFIQNIAVKLISKSCEYSDILCENIFNVIANDLNQVSSYDSSQNHFFLKRLIKAKLSDKPNKFTELFIESFSKVQLSNVYSTNRGCFILVL